jgi:hypothetical protein
VRLTVEGGPYDAWWRPSRGQEGPGSARIEKRRPGSVLGGGSVSPRRCGRAVAAATAVTTPAS